MGGGLAAYSSLATTVGGSVAGVASGIAQSRAYKQQAKYIEDQSRVAREEAIIEMTQKRREIVRFQADQKMEYLKSGVTLEGSPLLMLAETRRLGQEELNAMARRATAVSKLYALNASQARQTGRNSLIGGVTTGLMYGAANMLQSARVGGYAGFNNNTGLFTAPAKPAALSMVREWSRGSGT